MGIAANPNRPSGGVAASARRLARGALTERSWAIAILDQTLDDVLAGAQLTGRVLTAPDRWLYWADPFVVAGPDHSIWVFVEEFPRWHGLGHIVALHFNRGRLLTRACVLTSTHHLSFPQVHATDSGYLATVETCDPQQSIYSFDALGEPWKPLGFNLPSGLVDPAMGRDLTGTWLVTGSDRSRATENRVRQFATSSGNPGDWQEAGSWSHGNLARGGGALDPVRRLRVIQDCSENYGAAMGLAVWPPGHDVEEPTVARWIRKEDLAAFQGAWQGSHTMNWTPDGTTVVIDLWRRRPQVVSLAHRYLEFRRDPCHKQARQSRTSLMPL